MSEHQNRHPAGTPTGGQYAAGIRAAADPSVTLDTPSNGHIHTVAADSGWNLLAEVAADLNYQGEVHSDSLQLVDIDMATDLGEEYIGPGIDSAEDCLERQWRRDGGGLEGDDDEPDEDYRPGPTLDSDGLRARCEAAGLPPYVVGFIEAVEDRGNIPASYLNTLGVRDLAEIDEAVSDQVGELARRLRELDPHLAMPRAA